MSNEIPRDGRFDRTVTSQMASSEVHIGDVLIERYRIVRMIGMGGMGVVFEAFDEQLNEPVAIKLLHSKLEQDSEVLERFRNELLTARQVSHPNVVRLHDLVHDKAHQRWFITMDYVPGDSLQKILDRDGKLDVETSVGWLKQVAAGLAAAHARDIVHRDLKPANILIDPNGNALIADFGIARSLSRSGLTREGVLLGTPDYLSPEQARGDVVDGRSDLYALGLVLCEMLTGRLPFNAATADEAITQRLARSPTPLLHGQDGVPRWLARACHRLLRRNVARRYQTADELLTDLARERVAFKPSRRWYGGAAAATVAALGLSYFAWQATLQPIEAPAPSTGPGIAIEADPTVALLGITGPSVSGQESLALTAALVERLQDAGAADLADSLRVSVALAQLQLPVDRVGDHVGRVAEELNSGELIVLQDVGEVLTASIYRRADGFRQAEEIAVQGVNRIDRLNRLAVRLKELWQLDAPVEPLPAAIQTLIDFRLGLRALELGESITAQRLLSHVVDDAPEHTGAWWALSRAHESLGQWDQAIYSAGQASANPEDESRYAVLARARRAELDGDPDQATRLIAGLIAVHPGDLVLQTLAAETLGEGGELEQAIQRLESVTQRSPHSPRAWFLLAKYSILAGKVKDALDEYLVRAQVLHNRLDNRQGQADVANAFGVAYERTGEVDLAIQQYEQAVQLREQIGDARGQASSLRNLSAMRAVHGEFDLAETHLGRARVLLTALGDRKGLADTYNDEGFLAEERGDYPAALSAYREALKLRQELADQQAIADSYSNVGYAYYQTGEYDNALVYWRLAQDSYSELGDVSGEVRVSQQVGLLRLARGDWTDAEAILRQAALDAERNQMHEELAVSRGLLAEVLLVQGQLDEALTEIEAAATGFVQRDDQRGQYEMALLRTRVWLAADAPQPASEALQLAAESEGANLEQQANRFLLECRIDLRNGDLEAAEEALDRARELAGRSGSRRTQIEASLLAGRIQTARGVATAGLHADLLEQTRRLGHAVLTFDALVGGLKAAIGRDDATAVSAWSVLLEEFVQPLGPTAGGAGVAALRLESCQLQGVDCATAQDGLKQALTIASRLHGNSH